MRLGIVAALLALACGGAEAPETRDELPPEPTSDLTGTVESIDLQDINEAEGRFAYSVDLQVRVATLEPAPEVPAEVVTVRVRRNMRWTDLDEAEQARIAPDGPQPQLSLTRWAEFEVGQPVSLVVTGDPALYIRKRPER